jgi:hypothetical protein
MTTRSSTSTRGWLPWVLLALTTGLVLVMVPLSAGHLSRPEAITYGLRALAFGVMGTLVVSRQPHNRIGWIFCGFGLWGAFVETWGAFEYHSLPTGIAGELVATCTWVVDVMVYAIIFLLFPTGRLMTHRWRYAIWVLVSGCLLVVPWQALTPESGVEYTSGVNPFAVDTIAVQVAKYLGGIVLVAGTLACVAAVVIRYRRATGIERLQLRVFVVAGGLSIVGLVALALLYYDYARVRSFGPLVFLILPIAAGLAILRYRLYDIDGIINRTLVYGTLTVLGAASYAIWVVALQSLLDPFAQGSDLAVAGATLVVAALFRPAHRRVQRAVDRRFYRQTYDAARSIDAFSTRLRDQVDLDVLTTDIRTVVQETLQPTVVSLWLRPEI